ncbi:hypothetical protein [Psychrobacillus vulpis]|uniref:Tubby C-terminal domain-containing protein n=1 Tax=Psychrobacillus vulpis TaxID=2325572 RepID=A0A544TW61_9BACI|nr:hypothetical protein [Psychrobacillus vulpis]TQR21664.1 hypothetical protein FG384_01530 [Psychrobacillus vulpis]
MNKYLYTQPLAIETTSLISVYNNEGIEAYKFQRYYSNKLKRFFDKLMDYRYFLQYNVYDTHGQIIFTCKKVSQKGRVYYEATDYAEHRKYMVTYDKWKELIPDLLITDGNMQIKLDKELEGWSRFIYNDKEIARWKADLSEGFLVQLEIEEDSPIQNGAFFIGISQCALFIGA